MCNAAPRHGRDATTAPTGGATHLPSRPWFAFRSQFQFQFTRFEPISKPRAIWRPAMLCSPMQNALPLFTYRLLKSPKQPSPSAPRTHVQLYCDTTQGQGFRKQYEAPSISVGRPSLIKPQSFSKGPSVNHNNIVLAGRSFPPSEKNLGKRRG